MQNVSFISLSGRTFSPTPGLVHLKLILLTWILNRFEHQTQVEVVLNQYLIQMSRAGFLGLFHSVAAADVKASPQQDLLLNVRFMIQRCVLVPELHSVMRR